jgi:hypothetical protein
MPCKTHPRRLHCGAMRQCDRFQPFFIYK